MSDRTPDTQDNPEPPFFGSLATRLQGLAPPVGRAQALQAALMHRVQTSAAAHREYTTVREADMAWQPAADGVCTSLLRSDAHTRVEMQRLAPGAVLAWPASATAQEILLLQGSLSCTAGPVVTAGLQGARGYTVRERCADTVTLVADTETTVYVRHLLVDANDLPPLEARWWRMTPARPGWVDLGRKRWRATSPGVEVLPLRGDADVVSMLVRFAAGASVPDHGHMLDEDCLVLQGDMFLGDILLRAGDYQLAPAGGSHFGETSDGGVLFFFHGSLDPVLKGEPRVQA